jgi:peptide-methionine (S)-S-oxide reductase
MIRRSILAALLLLAACGSDYQPKLAPSEAQAPAAAAPETTATAVFAGGCFWCTEADFEKVPGVTGAVSGYTGGRSADPSYEQVSAGGTGHYEAVRVSYDPSRVSYQQLADYYFRTVDPTDGEGQFCDKGESYRTAIFYADDDQRKIADREKAEASRTLGQAVATAILPAKAFYEAEGYHQDYYKKNSLKYRFYRSRCGRDERLAELWGPKAKG